MVSVIFVGLFVLIRLALADAWNVYDLTPVCLIDAFTVKPLITPTNAKSPGPVIVKEPGGIVTVKLPIRSVTASKAGLIPLLVLPNVKLEVRLNNGWYEETVSLAVKVLNTLMAGCMNKPNAKGLAPTVIGEPTTVLVAVLITDTVLAQIGRAHV